MPPVAVYGRPHIAIISPRGVKHWQIGRRCVEFPRSALKYERGRRRDVNVVSFEWFRTQGKHRKIRRAHLQLLCLRGILRIVRV